MSKRKLTKRVINRSTNETITGTHEPQMLFCYSKNQISNPKLTKGVHVGRDHDACWFKLPDRDFNTIPSHLVYSASCIIDTRHRCLKNRYNNERAVTDQQFLDQLTKSHPLTWDELTTLIR